jgi:hypothetical protein
MADLSVDIDSVAPIIFLKNVNDLPVKLNLLDPFKNKKDLFYFCIDLFFKGLYLMNEITNGKLIINNMSMEDIYKVIRKMMNVKIKTHIFIKGSIPQSNAHKVINEGLEELKMMDDNEPLEKYVMKMLINTSVYNIYFTILN